jgi:hypothetical protein
VPSTVSEISKKFVTNFASGRPQFFAILYFEDLQKLALSLPVTAQFQQKFTSPKRVAMEAAAATP